MGVEEKLVEEKLGEEDEGGEGMQHKRKYIQKTSPCEKCVKKYGNRYFMLKNENKILCFHKNPTDRKAIRRRKRRRKSVYTTSFYLM